MARTALFFPDNLYGRHGTSSGFLHTPGGHGNHIENVSDVRPGVAWVSGRGEPRCLVDAFALYLEASLSPSSDISKITTTFQGECSPVELANGLTAAMTSAGGIFTGWSCAYDAINRKFTFSRSGGSDLVLRWKTGASGSDGDRDSFAREMGFDDSYDTGVSGSHTSDYKIGQSFSWINFSVPEEDAEPLALWACVLHGVEDEDQHEAVMYHAPTSHGQSPPIWQTGATAVPFSPQPSAPESRDDNRLRLAVTASATTTNRWQFFLWRHWDGELFHRVGFVKGYAAVSSSSNRSIQQLTGHTLFDPSPPLNPDNYYALKSLKRWQIPLAFNSWPADEYRLMVTDLVRAGTQRGLVWILDWETLYATAGGAAGMKTACTNAVEAGHAVYCTLQSYSGDTYTGAASAYLSGEVLLEQLR